MWGWLAGGLKRGMGTKGYWLLAEEKGFSSPYSRVSRQSVHTFGCEHIAGQSTEGYPHVHSNTGRLCVVSGLLGSRLGPDDARLGMCFPLRMTEGWQGWSPFGSVHWTSSCESHKGMT